MLKKISDSILFAIIAIVFFPTGMVVPNGSDLASFWIVFMWTILTLPITIPLLILAMVFITIHSIIQ